MLLQCACNLTVYLLPPTGPLMDAVIIWNLPLKVSLCKPTLNYLIVPLAGMADSAFLRLLPPDYFDQVSLPRGGLTSSLLPNARAVSVAVHQAHEETKHRNKSISQMVMQFGQGGNL